MPDFLSWLHSVIIDANHVANALWPYMLPLQMIVGAFVLFFALRTYGFTGLLVCTSAILFFFTIEPKIIPELCGWDGEKCASPSVMWIPFWYLCIDLLFLMFHAAGPKHKEHHFDIGNGGYLSQMIILFLMMLCHAIQFLNVANPPFSLWVLETPVAYFAEFLYTIVIVALHIAQVVALKKGVRDGIRAGLSVFRHGLVNWRGFGASNSRNKGAS